MANMFIVFPVSEPVPSAPAEVSPQSSHSSDFGDTNSFLSELNMPFDQAWLSDDKLFDELLTGSPAVTAPAHSPPFADIHATPALFPESGTGTAYEGFFSELPKEAVDAANFMATSPVGLPVLTQPSPVSTVHLPSPEFAAPLDSFGADNTWASPDVTVENLFPKLMPAVEQIRGAIQIPAESPVVKPVAQPEALKPKVASPVTAPLVPAIAPLSAALLPLLGNIGSTAANLALNPTALAAAAAATGVQVQQLQQQLQALANMQARQTPTLVKSTVELTPPYTVGRKRKERPTDAAAILAELDMKRQKNTEAARRSRAKKMEKMAELEDQVKSLTAERDELKVKVSEMEEKDKVMVQQMSEIRRLREKLRMYEGAMQ